MKSLSIGKDIVRSSYQQELMDELINSTAGVLAFKVPACVGMSSGRAASIGLSKIETIQDLEVMELRQRIAGLVYLFR